MLRINFFLEIHIAILKKVVENSRLFGHIYNVHRFLRHQAEC